MIPRLRTDAARLSRNRPALIRRASWHPAMARAQVQESHARFASQAAGASMASLDEILEAAKEIQDESASSEAAAPKLMGQQGCLWFANIYPTKAFRLDFRQAFTHHNHTDLIPRLLPDGVEVLRMVPREREGGAFVYFRAPPSFVFKVLQNLTKDEQPTRQRFIRKGGEDVLEKVCSGITQYLKRHKVQARLCPHPVRAYRVQGEPFLEDLDSRFPSSHVRIRFDCGLDKVAEEDLYARLRPFGQMGDLHVSSDGKHFIASFTYTAAAAAARNCLHRAPLRVASAESGETAGKMYIDFEPFMQRWIWDTIRNNMRYSIALVTFFIMGTTYLVLDGYRTFSVQLRIARSLVPEDPAQEKSRRVRRLVDVFMWISTSWNQARAQLSNWTGGRKSHASGLMQDFMADRADEIKELRLWLEQVHDRLMLLTGSRGNGQAAFVRQVVGSRAVYVDMEPILEAGASADDSLFLRRLCRAVGYSPPPISDRYLSAALDLLLPGTGKLSRENEVLNQVQRVLAGVTQALIALRQRRLDDLTLDSAPPLFVIEGFTSENKDRREGFFDLLVVWSAYVCEAKLARVVFVADSSFAERAILSALQERPERLDVEQFRDADPKIVRRILQRQLGEDRAASLSDNDLAIVGGRFGDISTMVTEVKAGHEPKEALRRMVDAAEMTTRTLLATGQPGAKWTRPQLWRAVRILAACGGDSSVPYDVFLWSVLRGDESALRSMSQSNLITVDPRARKVLPGSPVYAEVFRRLVQQEGFAAVLDLEVAKEDIKREQNTLDGYESQLVRLQEVDDVRHEKGRTLKDPNQALVQRKEQLLDLILEQHGKIAKYHAARRAAAAVIQRRSDDLKKSQ